LQYEDIQYANVNIYTFCKSLEEFSDDIAWFLDCKSKQDRDDPGRHGKGLQRSDSIIDLYDGKSMCTRLFVVSVHFC
jgi:hypothetical protein